MKLKYYLRGLGTGIVVTALVLGLSLSHGKAGISDEEVKRRAEELGMVEEFESLEEAAKEREKAKEDKAGVSGNQAADNKTSSVSRNTIGTETEQAKADDSKADEKKAASGDSGGKEQEKGGFGSSIGKDGENEANPKEEGNAKSEDETGNLTEEGEEIQRSAEEKTIILEVHSGDGSLSVARRAAEAGLVEDVAEFDRFLCRGGYDKRICTGKHEIPEGASMEEIAKLLVKKP